MNADTLFRLNGYEVTLGDMALAWLDKAAFTNAPWSSPESNLDVADFARVCLIDLNESGEEKVKGKLKLPIRSTPGGPVNRNALRAAAAALGGARGGLNAPAEAKRKAARTLVRLMREADIEVGDSLLSMAGMEKIEDVTKEWQADIIEKQDERQIAYGIVLRPNIPDLQGDIYTAEEVEKAAHSYMAKQAGLTDWLHQKELPRDQAVLVESIIIWQDMGWNEHKLKKGDWVAGVWIPDKDKWQEVKKGNVNAFSVRGYGKRRQITNS